MLVSNYLWCLQCDLHDILHEGGSLDQKVWYEILAYQLLIKVYSTMLCTQGATHVFHSARTLNELYSATPLIPFSTCTTILWCSIGHLKSLCFFLDGINITVVLSNQKYLKPEIPPSAVSRNIGWNWSWERLVGWEKFRELQSRGWTML